MQIEIDLKKKTCLKSILKTVKGTVLKQITL